MGYLMMFWRSFNKGFVEAIGVALVFSMGVVVGDKQLSFLSGLCLLLIGNFVVDLFYGLSNRLWPNLDKRI